MSILFQLKKLFEKFPRATIFRYCHFCCFFISNNLFSFRVEFNGATNTQLTEAFSISLHLNEMQ